MVKSIRAEVCFLKEGSGVARQWRSGGERKRSGKTGSSEEPEPHPARRIVRRITTRETVMPMIRKVGLLVVAGLLSLAAQAGEPPMHEISAGDCWTKAMNAGDVDAVAACYVSDAVMWFPGGGMVRGVRPFARAMPTTSRPTRSRMAAWMTWGTWMRALPGLPGARSGSRWCPRPMASLSPSAAGSPTYRA